MIPLGATRLQSKKNLMKITNLIFSTLTLFTVNIASISISANTNHNDFYMSGSFTDKYSNKQLKVTGGKASSEQKGCEIEKAFDGNAETIYHSSWGNTKTQFPVILEFYFEQGEDIDFIEYHQRQSKENGEFQEFELWAKTKETNEYKKVGDFDFKDGNIQKPITLKERLTGATGVKFIINRGLNNFVSCAEMQFFQYGTPFDGYPNLFSDKLCTQLKDKLDQPEISNDKDPFFKQIAQHMLDGTYSKEYRIQEYTAYPPILSVASKLKISQYNSYENPTGIYFDAGEEVVIFVGETNDEYLSLCIPNFSKESEEHYTLFRGINKFKIRESGLGYISYFTPNYAQAQPIKIHIAGGRVNGYFDKNKHSQSDWKKNLEASIAKYFDIKGDYINLCYTTADLKAYCNDGMELISLYDDIVYQEFEIMGLVKYDRVPKNHMFARTVDIEGIFADAVGAGFGARFMNFLANAKRLKQEGTWAVAHELGHVNQIRPGLLWVSTTEVTNNIYSSLVRYKYTPNYMPLEHEIINDGDNNYVIGGRFNCFLNYGVLTGEQWLCQKGQDKMEDYQNGGDHFVKLVPLWQLLLYYKIAKGTSWSKPDWYADLAEKVRNTDDKDMSNGTLQLNFMRNTIDIVQEDLTDFFYTVGMLKPIDKYMDDYTKGQLTITQQDCDDLRNYAKKYKKPASAFIYYLSANSLKAFEEKKSVVGLYNKGIKLDKMKNVCTVDNNIWKNVTVFETYSGNKLTKIALVGTNSKDQTSTLVRYPEGSTRIEAIAWDGTKTLVYGKR